MRETTRPGGGYDDGGRYSGYDARPTDRSASYGRGAYDAGQQGAYREEPRSSRYQSYGGEGYSSVGRTAYYDNGPATKPGARTRPAPKRDRRPLIIAAAVVLVVLVAIVVAIASCAAGSGSAGDAASQAGDANLVASAAPQLGATATSSTSDTATLADTSASSTEKKLSFCAVGDNLANENTLQIADMWGGSGEGDGVYDFSPLYREIAPIVSSYDLAFVNQETVMGGNTDWSYSGYPSYNTPDSVAQALSDAGFDVVSSNTNHTYDYWTGTIEHSLQVWKNFPNFTVIGTYASEEEREQAHVVEVNGIRVGFLSYSYGQNGYELSDLPNDYYAVPWDDEKFAQDYVTTRAASDVVVVYMHGGDEYTSVPNDWQRHIAQTCADAGVDLVIGSHAHVIQEFEYVTRSTGGAMPCVYGLGDFVSSYTSYPETVLSGMFSCDIVLEATGTVRIENLAWTPLIEYWTVSEDGTPDDYVRLVSGMSEADAANDTLLASLGSDAYTWMRQHTHDVLDSSGIEIRD